MRPLVLRLAFLAGLALIALPNGSRASTQSAGSISGWVLDWDAGGVPIDGCEVYAEEYDAAATSGSGETDAGFFRISGLAAGDYRVTVHCDGYVREYAFNHYLSADADPISVADGNDTGIVINLGAAGNITGTVRNSGPGHSPVEGCDVVAERWLGGDYQAEGQTDANGFYSLDDVLPDAYVVHVQCDGYLEEFYDNANGWPDAEMLVIEANATTADIDFEPDLIGDSNQSGSVSMVDAMLVAQYVAGLIQGDGLNVTAADVNCSATTTMVDAMLIAQRVAGLIGEFSCPSQ